jgi:peptidyl-prolyl cis-trans isomerase C
MSIKTLIAAVAATFSVCVAAAEPGPDTVLVRKGDTTVTAGDFMAALERVPADQRFSFRADVDRISSAVSALFITRSLAGDARAQGIDKDPEVQRRLRLAEESLLAQIYVERLEKAIVTPDFEARAREIYKASPERFRLPASVHLRHLVVSFQGRTEEETRRRAEEARAQLLAGESFGRIVREYSNDPLVRSNDGKLEGPYNVLVEPVAEAARTIPLNQPSELIRSSQGYHLIVVSERVPESVVPYEKAKKQLIEAEQAKFRKAALDEKLGSITKSKDITLYTDEIAALATTVDRDALKKLHEEREQQNREAKERLIKEAAKPAGS